MRPRGGRTSPLRLVLPVVGVAGIVLGGFALVNVYQERAHMRDDLDRRARVLGRALLPQAQHLLGDPAGGDPRQLADHLRESGRTLGLVLCDGDRRLVAESDAVAGLVPCESPEVTAVIDGAAEENVWIMEDVGRPLRALVIAVPVGTGRAGGLVVVHDASYIDRRVTSQLSWSAAVLALLALLLAAATVSGLRATFARPLDRLADWMRRMRLGEGSEAEEPPPALPSEALALESERLAASLKAARAGAQALARQATETDSLWTRDRLRGHVLKMLQGAQLVVLSNREPYMHQRELGRVRVIRPASGLVTALDPVLRACEGLWVAHGGGDADRETADPAGRLVVPPGEGRYTLRRVWLSREEEEGYYYGLSNEGIWPLCHATHERPKFRQREWEHYVAANERFARAALEEIGSGRAVVLVQDFHLALVPRLLKRERPDLPVSLFWHIPWPNPEAFRICPWKTEILQGMLGADLVGFHVQHHCNNFLDTVDRMLEARIDWERFGVWQGGRLTHVRPFPISVQGWEERGVPAGEELAARLEQLRAEYKLGDALVAVGVDRIDYTKGIPDRIRAVARFLEANPAWIGRFVFVELGAPSRLHIKRYRDLVTEVEALADEVNWRFQTDSWKPILFLRDHHPPETVYAWLRLADLCIVSSLHDGMNLVAKEFVAARDDEEGVLILSEFTGAARELTDAILVNPYATEEFAEAIRRAIEIPPEERHSRMRRLRQQVSDRNVYRWARDLISQTVRLPRSEGGELRTPVRDGDPAHMAA
ncbi:MAG: trehalose-6-phosphate synthase [Acidobacteria bacterium]|nr:trehalose-6-phosphate synthase [Acidobacteriota bacterium]